MTTKELDFFNTIAEKWDSMEPASLPARINSLLDMIGLQPGMNVLDLGTGTGVLVPYLLDRIGPTGTVTAVDISTGMLSVAKSKHECRHNVRFLLQDFEKEPVEGCYDAILLYCVYPHLSNPVETLRRLRKNNLAAGGKMIVAFHCDAKSINSIHSQRNVDAGTLPDASELAYRLTQSGLHAEARSSAPYMVEIS